MKLKDVYFSGPVRAPSGRMIQSLSVDRDGIKSLVRQKTDDGLYELVATFNDASKLDGRDASGMISWHMVASYNYADVPAPAAKAK